MQRPLSCGGKHDEYRYRSVLDRDGRRCELPELGELSKDLFWKCCLLISTQEGRTALVNGFRNPCMRKLLMAHGATFHPKFTLLLLPHCYWNEEMLRQDMLEKWDEYIDTLVVV